MFSENLVWCPCTFREWAFALYLMAAYSRHPKITHFPPSACASSGLPHWTCCAQHTGTRWAFAESQFYWEEDWRTFSLPTSEGSAQAYTWRINNLWPERRQSALAAIFLERRKNLGGTFGWRFELKDQEHKTGTLLVAWGRPSNRCDFMHVEDLALTGVQYINYLNGSRKRTKTIS